MDVSNVINYANMFHKDNKTPIEFRPDLTKNIIKLNKFYDEQDAEELKYISELW